MRRLLAAWAALSGGPPWRGALLFAALFLTLALPRLTQPTDYVFDEVYQAYTAGRYAAGDRDAYVWSTKAYGPNKWCSYEWIHPPVAKLVLAASITVVGDRPLGWRLPCAFAGAALVGLVYLAARRMFPTRRGVAELAALALSLDGLAIVMSRTGMSDIFVGLFVLAAYLAFWRWMVLRFPDGEEPPDQRAARRQLYVVGLLVGLAVATKWFGLLAWGIIGLVVGAEAVVAAVTGLRAGRGARALAGVAHVAAAMVALPAAVYLASYIPFFAQGYGWEDFFELVRQQVYYHGHLTAKHDYASAWWTWPLVLRSVWLWTGTAGGVHRDIYVLGNPVLWWTAVIALVLLLGRGAAALAARKRLPHAESLLLLGFFGQWLPWSIPARPAFLYYMMTALPFMAIAVGWGGHELASRLGRPGRAAVALWVVVLVAAFVWLFPLWTGLSLGEAGWKARFLLPRWR